MYISTEIGSYYRYGDNKQVIKMLKNAGFDACDFSMMLNGRNDAFVDKYDYASRARELRKFVDGEGMAINQTHSPFPSARPGDEDYNGKALKLISRAIEVSGILGAKVCVVHPCNFYTAEQNAELVYAPITPAAKDCGVKIGVENMWNRKDGDEYASPAACSSPTDFMKHLSLLDEETFGACLDIGHAEMRGTGATAVSMIETLDKRLIALHLHDNDLVRDLHMMPFSYSINFEEIIIALKKIGYVGDVTLEADSVAPRLPIELYPSAARYAADVAKYLRSRLSPRDDAAVEKI